MLLFECTLASAGGALILTVTCDSAFAGQTITCTDGTTTLTQTCPSASPYTADFKIPNAGIWIISSGTDSTSIIIPDTADLHHIPTGSTVTPTDDIQTWLHCSNIWDKSYTTISQVLADASCLQALIASNNAVDYMARSTTWATDVTADSSAMSYIGLDDYCADALLTDSTWLNAICSSTYFESVLNVKVPTMTSNTTPSGQAFASSADGTNMAYKVFDNGIGETNSWSTPYNSSTVPQSVGYKFTQKVKVNKVRIYPGNANYATAFQIQGSNDGSNYTTIASLTNNKTTEYVDYVISNNDDYQYFRMYITAVNRGSASGTYVRVYELQFYGRAAT